jgi:hypothetical protein
MRNIFKIDPATLEPQPFNVFRKIIITTAIVSTILSSVFLYIGYDLGSDVLTGLSEEEKLVIIQEHNQFSEDRLIEKLKELNVKFPYIVFAQSKLETGNFTSKVFRENSNLFGMREAKQRITTAQGTENNHAYYASWGESVYDYAFYQCRYLSGINTEEQYFQYLSQSYAENPNYVSILKDMIVKENLKAKFGSSK